MNGATRGLRVHTGDLPGALVQIAGVIASRDAHLRRLEGMAAAAGATISFELEAGADVEELAEILRALPVVRSVQPSPSLEAIYGKRVIIVGGGAQVGQVAVGAISEADRHNIRGERISVDTIPLVGEEALAAAVGAVAQLPRAKVLVLAGAMMGGSITAAVTDLQRQGLIVIALNMAGSVRGVADLVVTDPVQAGVMAVMTIADTAAFDIARQRGKQY